MTSGISSRFSCDVLNQLCCNERVVKAFNDAAF